MAGERKLCCQLNAVDRMLRDYPGCRHDESGCLESCIAEPPASSWALSRLRRTLDISMAVLALATASVPMLIIAAGVRLSSHGGALFSQERVGLGGRLFRIYKFRTMEVRPAECSGPGLTEAGDQRVTPFGRWLRRLKLDELPQFFNILRGDMSLVGPRPKLPRYAAMFNMPYRPGMTGLATIAFLREEEILRECNPLELDNLYATRIKPLKTRLDACYMCRATPLTDTRLIASTILGIMAPAQTDSIPDLSSVHGCGSMVEARGHTSQCEDPFSVEPR